MEKVKFDNGLLLIAYLSNILTPLGIMVYFGIKYLTQPSDPESLFIMIPIGAFTVISLFMFARFKKLEFDDQYVYVKNVLNKEVDSFPIKNIKSVKQMMLSFKGKNNRGRSGKNYAITYINNDGGEKKVRVMATIDSEITRKFKELTSFLGAEGFNPE
jgi:hypothetical protein